MTRTIRSVHVVERGPIGNVMFHARDLAFYWNGPGAKVKLVYCQQLIGIDERYKVHINPDGTKVVILIDPTVPCMTERDARQVVYESMEHIFGWQS